MAGCLLACATRSLLIVYVDDFKLAAKHGEHDALWTSIRNVIDMDPETMDGRFLGCSHERFTPTAKYVHDILDNHPAYHPRPKQGGATAVKSGGTADAVEPVAKLYDPNKKVELVVNSMERFAKDCVTAFYEFSGYAKNKVGAAPTPFLDESNDPLVAIEEPAKKGTNGQKHAPEKPQRLFATARWNSRVPRDGRW